MRRATSLAVIGAVLIGFGAYAGFWWIAAGSIEDAILAWRQSAQKQKIEASWQSMRVGGFPLGFRIELSGVEVRDAGTAAVRAPALSASARPWNFRDWRLAAPDGISASAGAGAAPLAKLSATAASGAVAVAGDGGTTIWLTLDQPKVAAGAEIAARTADAWIIVPARPPQTHTEPGLAVAAALHDLAVPAPPPEFSNTIDDIGFGLTLMGAWPAGPLRQAAAAWRDSGGTIGLDRFELRWGELEITGSGTVALDNDLQPIGGFSGAIAGYDQLMSALVAAGRVKASDARVARLALAILAKAGPDGRPEISTSLTIQNGEMFLGPAKLGKAPRIDW